MFYYEEVIFVCLGHNKIDCISHFENIPSFTCMFARFFVPLQRNPTNWLADIL